MTKIICDFCHEETKNATRGYRYTKRIMHNGQLRSAEVSCSVELAEGGMRATLDVCLPCFIKMLKETTDANSPQPIPKVP